jgi:hypothetical protein
MSRAPLCLCRGPLAALIHRRAYPRAARAAVRPRRPRRERRLCVHAPIARAARAAVRPRRPRRERRLCVTPLAPPAPPVRLRDV